MKKFFWGFKNFAAAVIIGAAFEYDAEKAVALKIKAAEKAKKLKGKSSLPKHRTRFPKSPNSHYGVLMP